MKPQLDRQNEDCSEENEDRKNIVVPCFPCAVQKSSTADVITINRPVETVGSSSTTDIAKFRCSITSERLAELKKIVEEAARDHRVFTIKGN